MDRQYRASRGHDVEFEDWLQDTYSDIDDYFDGGYDEEDREWIVKDETTGRFVPSGVSEKGPIGKLKAFHNINGRDARKFKADQMAHSVMENKTKITRRQLKRIIRESLSNNPLNAQLGGKIGNRSGGTIDQQVRELVNAHYSLDQGYDQEEITDANDTVQRLQSEMSPEDFKKATEIAKLCVYYNEYATRADVDRVVEEIEAACAQLGLTAEDVI